MTLTNPLALVCLVTSALTALLGVFVYWQYGRRRIARIFLLWCLFGAVWVSFGFVYFGPFSDLSAGLWMEPLFACAPLTVAAFLHLILAFQGKGTAPRRGMENLAYGLSLGIGLLKFVQCPPGQFHRHPETNWLLDESQGVSYLFLAFILIFTSYGEIVLLLRFLKTESKLEKNKLGIFLAGQGASLGLLLLALVQKAQYLAVLSPLASYGVTAYTISRHRLFDFSFVMRKGQSSLAIGAGFVLVFSALVFLAYYTAQWLGFSPVAGVFAAGLLLTLMIHPLYRFFDPLARRWLKIRDFDSSSRQSGYSNLLMRSPLIGPYLEALLPKLREEMELRHIGFFWRDQKGEGWLFQKCFPQDWHPDSKELEHPLFYKALEASPQGLDVEELEMAGEGGGGEPERVRLAQVLRNLDCQVVMPVAGEGWLQGILLLGPKHSGRIFNPDEFHFLKVIGDHLGIALANGHIREILAATDHAAHHDALTGLPNRKHFNESLERMLAQDAGGGSGRALLFIDLDLFKWVNDNLGHPAGDQLLVVVAQRLRGCVAQGDLVARLGGDEFIVVAEAVGAKEARSLAERIIRSITEEMFLAGTQVQVGCSIGVGLYPQDARSKEELVQKADEALYRAKVTRNCVKFFSDELAREAQERERLKATFPEAFRQGRLLLHYQPKWDLRNHQPAGAEALLRWAHPERGLLNETAFIDVVEEIGIQGTLGDWVFERAASQQRAWKAGLHPPLPLSVNIFPKQFRDKNLGRRFLEILEDYRLDPKGFQLEITESAVLKNSGMILETLGTLRSAGVGVFLDNFGTGYSSISMLQRFNVDGLKIDRALVEGIGKDEKQESLLKASLSLGKSLGMEVVAKGVETQEQLDYLKKAGCLWAQGNFLGAALPPPEFEKLVRRSRSRPEGASAI